MREPTPISQLRRRLAELGCPARAARRIVRETGEHFEDLQLAALSRGETPREATRQAETQIGDPRQLAEQHVTQLRQATWWGRHPLLGFGAGPLLLVPLFVLATWLVFALICTGAEKLLGEETWTQGPLGVQVMVAGLSLIYYAQILLAPLFLCYLVRRSALEFKWALLACALTSVLVFLYYLETSVFRATAQHEARVNVTMGVVVWKNWAEVVSPRSFPFYALGLKRAMLPLLIAAWAYCRWWRNEAATHVEEGVAPGKSPVLAD